MLKDVLSRVRLILEDAQEKLSVESAAAIEQVFSDLNHLNAFINKEVAKIVSDESLQPRAKSIARRKVLEQAGRKLEVVKAKRSLSDVVESLKSKIATAVEKEETSLLKYLHEREVRDRLLGMTEAQILSLFGETLFNGSNPLLLNAILNAPAGFEMLPQDTLDKLRLVRAKLLSPEVAAELEETHNLNSAIEQMLKQVKKELDRLRKKELPVTLAQKYQAQLRYLENDEGDMR